MIRIGEIVIHAQSFRDGFVFGELLAMVYKAGEKLMVDFAGDKLPYVDPETGEIAKAEVFVACIRDFGSNPRPRFNTYSRQMFLEKHSEEAAVEKFREVLQH
jgi:hypothetical protein